MDKISQKNRIHLLDEIRGFAVLCMVIYHGLYILGDFFSQRWATDLFDGLTPVEPFFAGLFIAVCGISCSLSHSNLKRGIKIFSVALGFTFVTAVIMPLMGFVECEIWFGILHFLGVCVLIYALIEKKSRGFNPYMGILACAILFPFFSGIEQGVLSYGNLIVLNIPKALYEHNWLVPLGIYNNNFASADYFPVFPDIFIFFAGVFGGRILKAKGFPDYAYKSRAPFFALLGRKAFIVYIIHMPIIAGFAYGIEFVINLVK